MEIGMNPADFFVNMHEKFATKIEIDAFGELLDHQRNVQSRFIQLEEKIKLCFLDFILQRKKKNNFAAATTTNR